MVSNLPQREEYLRKKRKKKLIKFGLVFIVIILLISLASYISHRKKFRISEVSLSGGVLVTENDVKLKTLEFLGGSYYWIFPKNNFAWYPKKDLKNNLKSSFKRIDSIDINLDGYNSIVIKITEKKPVATWCDKIPDKNFLLTPEDYSNIENCYFIDDNSAIFAPAPHFSGNAYFKYYGLVSTSTNPIGSYYISSPLEFNDLASFVDEVKLLEVYPLYLVAKGSGEFSLVLYGGGEILFDNKEPLKKVAENLKALLRTPEMSTTTANYLPVDYIDLRFGNKLFYKLKNQ